jgi:hypothetical protein
MSGRDWTERGTTHDGTDRSRISTADYSPASYTSLFIAMSAPIVSVALVQVLVRAMAQPGFPIAWGSAPLRWGPSLILPVLTAVLLFRRLRSRDEALAFLIGCALAVYSVQTLPGSLNWPGGPESPWLGPWRLWGPVVFSAALVGASSLLVRHGRGTPIMAVLAAYLATCVLTLIDSTRVKGFEEFRPYLQIWPPAICVVVLVALWVWEVRTGEA